MKFFIIAGEASGDMHAAKLIAQLQSQQTNTHFVGMGGDKMQASGCQLLQHYQEMAFMGVIAVLANLTKIRNNFKIAKEGLLQHKPDVLILVDYPSFNLKIAKFCKTHLPDTKIFYYIPPKIWAWKTWRVHQIAKYCDEVWGIFPFEPDFYARYGYSCRYVGNPTFDALTEWKNINFPKGYGIQQRKEIIAILPGSRKSEITHCLPKMLQAARMVAAQYPNMQIHVAQAPGISPELYQQYVQDETLRNDTYELLSQAKVAVVNSGTATLEAAILECPQTAVYHIACSKWVMWLKPILFKIPHFTLVNIIARREVIRELIAIDFTVANIVNELEQLLNDTAYVDQMLQEYEQIASTLKSNPISLTKLI